MKFLKTFFASLLLFIFICVIGITFLILTIDPNKLKPVIASEVKKKTGYEVFIQGNLSWSFYPLAIRMHRLTLTQPNQLEPLVNLDDIKISVSSLELLNSKETLQGNVHIGNVNFKNVQAQNVNTKLLWQKDGFILQPIRANFYGGKLEGSMQGQSLLDIPYWNWDLQLTQIQLKPLFEAIYGSQAKFKMSGLGQIKFNIGSQGKTKNQILNQLNGTTEFSINDGAIEGLDLNYYIQTAEALVGRESITNINETNQTHFNQLMAAAIIKNGIIYSKNLLLVSPSFITRGAGSIILYTQDMDLELKIQPQKNSKISWKIPLEIVGKVNNPNIQLDASEIQKLIVKREIDKIKDKARDHVKKLLPGDTVEFLQNLLSN